MRNDQGGYLPEQDPTAGPVSPRHDMHWFFWGPNGLRAGWSMLVFVCIFAALLIGSSFVVGRYFRGMPRNGLPPGMAILSELWQFGVLAIVVALMALIERRPVLFYGLQGSARVVRLLSGLIWGFVAISALVLGMRALGFLSLDGLTLSGTAALHYALLWGFMFLLVGFFEESLFRGYLQFTLTRGIGFWWGALLFAVLFGATHRGNPGESPVGLVSAGAVGLVFCLSLWYTGSLWWAVGFHAAWDWGQSYLYGTADSGMLVRGHLFREHPVGPVLWSGGTTGPEGSLLIVPLLLVMALLMYLWWGRRVRSPFAGAAWRPLRTELSLQETHHAAEAGPLS